MNKSSLDGSIPMLTEIIDPLPELQPGLELPPASVPQEPEPPLPPPNAPVFAEPAVVPPTQPQPLIQPGMSPAQWQALEQTLRERVLLQLQNRIDFILEHRVRDSLADVLQTAVASLADEIRAGLQHTLKEVIERAVAQEIAKLQSGKQN